MHRPFLTFLPWDWLEMRAGLTSLGSIINKSTSLGEWQWHLCQRSHGDSLKASLDQSPMKARQLVCENGENI